MSMRIMTAPLLPAVLLLGLAAASAQTGLDERKDAENKLREILAEPPVQVRKLTPTPRAQFRGPLVVPLNEAEDLRARKNEALRRFEEQQRLDVERELRDALRQR